MFLYGLLLSVCLSLLGVHARVRVPAACCVDHMFQATLGEIGGAISPDGTPIVLDGYNRIAYDWYNGRLGMQAHLLQADHTMKATNVTIDYNAKKQYITQSDGSCIEMAITDDMREPCIPATATSIASSYFGFGNNKLSINVWKFMRPHTDNVVQMAVTEPGCIPVVEATYGTIQGEKTDIVYFVTDFQPGIAQPEMLATPSTACRHIEAHDEVIPGSVRRSVEAVRRIYSR